VALYQPIICGAFPARIQPKGKLLHGQKRGEPRKYENPTSFEQARDELFSHILRCGVLKPHPSIRREWFDTLLYLADRFTDLTETEMNELRVLGERYCRPVVARTTLSAPSA
jgi:hypothetical protein